MAVILELFQAGPSGNLIDNWFFPTNITTGWTTVNFTTAEQSSTYARFEKFSAHFADATFDGDEAFYTDLIPGIVVGVEYTFSLWLKKVTCTGTGQMILHWYTAADAYISEELLAFDAGTHDWKQYSITATAPATAAKARVLAFYFTGVTVGTAFDAYVDGVVFSRTGAAVGYLDLNAAAGAGIRASAWHQAVASPVYGGQPPPIKESMDLMVESTTHDLLAGHIQALDSYRVQADAYMRNRTTEYPVWLECKMSDETGTRRALVRSIEMGYRLPLYAEHHGPPQNTTNIRLELWRQPWWEDVAVSVLPSATPAAAAAVIYDYTATADVVGDVGARINCLQIAPEAAGDNIDRLWMGIRAGHGHGTAANFVPIWECEAGTNRTDTADVVDATASAGNKVTVTPGTATWATRLWMFLVTFAGGNEDDQMGNFLWLLRSKVSAGTWQAQFMWGYANMASEDNFVRGPIVEIASTSWNYYEMGSNRMGIRDMQVAGTDLLASSAEGQFALFIRARRTAGAGTLDMDCVCPVPLDMGWSVIKGAQGTYTSGDPDIRSLITYAVGPSEKKIAYTFWQNTTIESVQAVPALSTDGLYLPPGDGRLIIVYAREITSDITDVIEVGSLSPTTQGYYERWASLRGVE